MRDNRIGSYFIVNEDGRTSYVGKNKKIAIKEYNDLMKNQNKRPGIYSLIYLVKTSRTDL